jgi:hypothetical protein
MSNEWTRPIDFQDDGVRTAAAFLKLAEVHDALKKIAGPKTILWLTTGVSNLMRTPYGCRDVTFPGEPGYVAGKCVPTCGKYGPGTTCIDYTPFVRHFATDLQCSGTSLSLLAGARLFPRGQTESALNGALMDSLARYRISFAGAPDGKGQSVILWRARNKRDEPGHHRSARQEGSTRAAFSFSFQE